MKRILLLAVWTPLSCVAFSLSADGRTTQQYECQGNYNSNRYDSYSASNCSDLLSMTEDDIADFIIAGGTISELRQTRRKQAYKQILDKDPGLYDGSFCSRPLWTETLRPEQRAPRRAALKKLREEVFPAQRAAREAKWAAIRERQEARRRAYEEWLRSWGPWHCRRWHWRPWYWRPWFWRPWVW